MMKKKLLIFIALFLVVIGFLLVFWMKNTTADVSNEVVYNIGGFSKKMPCSRQPNFLNKLKIPQPVAIDLSQQNYKGIAFLYGRDLTQALHFKTWEKFDHFSTYALDPKGNMYLSPMPFISIKAKTFEFQKNIYRLDSDTGSLSVWMTLDEVRSGEENPYGVIALEYDCDDHSLWIASVDKTDYQTKRGTLYHIDIVSKRIIQKVSGIDALSLKLLRSTYGKHLLYGSATESAMFLLKIEEGVLSSIPVKLFDLPQANEYIRKIRVGVKNHIKVETIPFSYSLVAQTTSKLRNYYEYVWDTKRKIWSELE
jgi:hypothetical protein